MTRPNNLSPTETFMVMETITEIDWSNPVPVQNAVEATVSVETTGSTEGSGGAN